MSFGKCKTKYFIIVEGEDRAIIRDTEVQAEKKRKQLAKFSRGKKISVFKSSEKSN